MRQHLINGFNMQKRDEAILFEACDAKIMPAYGNSLHPLPFSEGGLISH
jgi:hypothetical protein